MQRDALLNALIEILRTISDKGKVTMVLPSEDEVFVDHSASYFHDTITEKVRIYKGVQNLKSSWTALYLIHVSFFLFFVSFFSNFSVFLFYSAALHFYIVPQRGTGALYEAQFKIRRNPSYIKYPTLLLLSRPNCTHSENVYIKEKSCKLKYIHIISIIFYIEEISL